MKLKRTALLSLGALIGFTLFYIGLNEWQHEKESTGKINIVTSSPIPSQPQTSISPSTPANTTNTPQTQTPTSSPSISTTPAPSTTATPPQNIPSQTSKSQKAPQKSTPPKTISQIIKNSQEEVSQNTYKTESLLFQVGAFKSQTALERAITKVKALGFEPIVSQQKGFYIVRVKLNSSQEGLKLLTAFPGAFRVR